MTDPGGKTEWVIIQEQQRAAPAPGSGGSTPANWATIAEGWAKLLPLRGSEQVQAEREQAQTTFRVYMDRDAIVDIIGKLSGCKLIWETNGNTELNIRQVLDQGATVMEMQFLAEMGAPA